MHYASQIVPAVPCCPVFVFTLFQNLLMKTRFQMNENLVTLTFLFFWGFFYTGLGNTICILYIFFCIVKNVIFNKQSIECLNRVETL